VPGQRIEFFTVRPDEDEQFLSAWAAEPRDATLLRALRDDVQPRFASLTDAPGGGVFLIGQFEVPETTRQGFLGVRTDGELTIAHWSSPLMYARTGWKLTGELYARVETPPTASSQHPPGS
jgi:hypothetical protein